MKYVYCPQCGTEFSAEEQKRFEIQQNNISCGKCPFVFYNNPNPAISAIIKNVNGKVLLTKRGIEPFKGDWDLPGGFIDYGELPQDAVLRELEEELGIKKVKDIEFLNVFNVDYVNEGREDERIQVLTMVFNVIIDESEITGASDDVEEYRFFKVENLPKNIAFPEQGKFFNAHFLHN